MSNTCNVEDDTPCPVAGAQTTITSLQAPLPVGEHRVVYSRGAHSPSATEDRASTGLLVWRAKSSPQVSKAIVSLVIPDRQ